MSKTKPATAELQFGLDNFGDLPLDEHGKPTSHAAAIRQVVEEAILADKLGVDVIAWVNTTAKNIPSRAQKPSWLASPVSRKIFAWHQV